MLLGLLLNCALALLAEYFADPMPDPENIGAAFGRPLLATIPSLSFPKAGSARSAAPLAGPYDGVPGKKVPSQTRAGV